MLVGAGKRENGRWKRGSLDKRSSADITGWDTAMRYAGVILDHAADLAAGAQSYAPEPRPAVSTVVDRSASTSNQLGKFPSSK